MVSVKFALKFQKKIELTMYVKINTEEKQDIPGVEKQLV